MNTNKKENKMKNNIKKATGKTLQQWGDEYGVTKERVRQLYNRWGTINDELMKSRNAGDKATWKHTTSKYQKWQGLKLHELCEKHNTYSRKIQVWYYYYPTLTWEQFETASKSSKI